MFIQETNSPLVVVTDFRLVSDVEYDRENDTSNSVMRLWGAAKKYMYQSQWDGLTKVALFEPHAKLKPGKELRGKELTSERKRLAQAREAVKAELREYLLKRKPKLIVVLQTRSATARKNKEIESVENDANGTLCWDIFGAPGSINEIAGTVFDSALGPVMGIPNPVNVEYVYEELIRRWFQGALEYARTGGANQLRCREMYDTRDSFDVGLAKVYRSALAGKPIALDLEFVPAHNLITVMGLSDGERSVACPWDPYQPPDSDMAEPGATAQQKDLVRRILAEAKLVYVYNGIAADLPLLKANGLEIKGKVFDSYLAHGLTYRQYRKGLQQAVATSFIVEPWKSSFRATDKFNVGEPGYWLSAPKALRKYNCNDSFMTWHQAQRAMFELGITEKDLP